MAWRHEWVSASKRRVLIADSMLSEISRAVTSAPDADYEGSQLLGCCSPCKGVLAKSKEGLSARNALPEL